jgi:hypothetical protein
LEINDARSSCTRSIRTTPHRPALTRRVSRGLVSGSWSMIPTASSNVLSRWCDSGRAGVAIEKPPRNLGSAPAGRLCTSLPPQRVGRANAATVVRSATTDCVPDDVQLSVMSNPPCSDVAGHAVVNRTVFADCYLDTRLSCLCYWSSMRGDRSEHVPQIRLLRPSVDVYILCLVALFNAQ